MGYQDCPRSAETGLDVSVPHDTAKLLLLEDSPSDADLVQLSLAETAEPFDVVRAERLAQATDWLASETAGCALVDLSLPDAEGLDVIAALKQAAPELPLVVLSGATDEAVALRAVREGAQDYLMKGEATGALVARSIRYAIERKRTEIDLTYRAFHDPLTGLANRRLLLDRLDHALAHRGGPTCAVLLLDLDGFKPINDELGHDAGDQVLLEVADRLRTTLRPADTKARLGGDEFVVLCEQVELPDARCVAGRLAAAISAPMAVDGRELVVGMSLGLAMADEGSDASGILAAADRAMYEAKAQGGGVALAAPASA